MAQHGFDYEAMRRRALYSALMSASSGFMQAGAPSLLPGGNQAALGQGLMGATQGYNNSMMDIAGMRQQDQRYNAEQERLKAARNYRIGRDVLADTRYTETQGYNRGRDTAGDALSAEALTYDRGRDTAGDLFRTAGRSYDQARDTAGDAFRDEGRTYDRGQDLEAAAIAAEKVEFERANPGLKHAATFPKKHLANGQIQLQKYNPDGTLSDYGSPYWPKARGAREIKIAQYTQDFPEMNRQQVIDAVDKNRVIERDGLGNIWSLSTTTGDKRMLVDVTAPPGQTVDAAGDKQPSPDPSLEQPPAGPLSVVTPGKRLVAEDAAYDALGIEESMGQGYDGIAGFLWGADQSYPETAESRDYIRKIREAIVAANLKNPKGLASEMERLLKIAPSADGWFRNPGGNRMKARAMRAFLMQNNASDEYAIATERMSPKARQETLDKIVARKDLLRMMGLPNGDINHPSVQMGSAQYPFSPQTQEEFDKLSVGDYFIDDDGLKVKE